MKKKNYTTILMFASILCISMIASVVTSVFSINAISLKNNKTDNLAVASLIGNRLESCFLRPITVSETMSQDFSMKSLMRNELGFTAEEQEDYYSSYLKAIRDGFNYQMVFAVSDETRAYYTFDGISKFVKPETDAHDLWYSNFLNAHELYLLDVDTDEANGNSLTVFFNTSVYDEDSSFLGVCGVGVEMTEIQEIMKVFEEKYGVKINLVDRTGLIQIDTDSSKIEKDYVDSSYFTKISQTEYNYEKIGHSARITYYMENLHWYLVITDNNLDNIGVEKVVTAPILISIIGLICMMAAAYSISKKESRLSMELTKTTTMSLMDEMTKLYNRRSYEEDCKRWRESVRLHSITLIALDVNGLKNTNDQIGHDAGDELIIAAANQLKEVFSKYGKIYRIGGDEFMAILDISLNELENSQKKLEENLANFDGIQIHELSMAMGIVHTEDYPEKNFDEMLKIADQLMYDDKKAYYVRKGIIR